MNPFYIYDENGNPVFAYTISNAGTYSVFSLNDDKTVVPQSLKTYNQDEFKKMLTDAYVVGATTDNGALDYEITTKMNPDLVEKGILKPNTATTSGVEVPATVMPPSKEGMPKYETGWDKYLVKEAADKFAQNNVQNPVNQQIPFPTASLPPSRPVTNGVEITPDSPIPQADLDRAAFNNNFEKLLPYSPEKHGSENITPMPRTDPNAPMIMETLPNNNDGSGGKQTVMVPDKANPTTVDPNAVATNPAAATPPATTPTILKPLPSKIDTKNKEHVKELQIALGMDPKDADGVYGPKTKAKVIEFQKKNSLTPDGVVGAKTIAQLEASRVPAVTTPAVANNGTNPAVANAATTAPVPANDFLPFLKKDEPAITVPFTPGFKPADKAVAPNATTTTTTNTPATTTAATTDVNGDGVIDAKDVVSTEEVTAELDPNLSSTYRPFLTHRETNGRWEKTPGAQFTEQRTRKVYEPYWKNQEMDTASATVVNNLLGKVFGSKEERRSRRDERNQNSQNNQSNEYVDNEEDVAPNAVVNNPNATANNQTGNGLEGKRPMARNPRSLIQNPMLGLAQEVLADNRGIVPKFEDPKDARRFYKAIDIAKRMEQRENNRINREHNRNAAKISKAEEWHRKSQEKLGRYPGPIQSTEAPQTNPVPVEPSTNATAPVTTATTQAPVATTQAATTTQAAPAPVASPTIVVPSQEEVSGFLNSMKTPKNQFGGQVGQSGIHINPNNRGKFTESANHAGMGVQAFANKVLANKDDYSPTTVKRANFAHNAAGWNRQEGGDVGPFSRPNNAKYRFDGLDELPEFRINYDPNKQTTKSTIGTAPVYGDLSKATSLDSKIDPNSATMNLNTPKIDPTEYGSIKFNFPTNTQKSAATNTTSGEVVANPWDNTKINIYGNRMQHEANMLPVMYNTAKSLFDKPEVQNPMYNKQDVAFLQGMRRNQINANMNPMVENRAMMNQVIRGNARGSGQLLAAMQTNSSNAARAMNDELYRVKGANQAQQNNYLNALSQVGNNRREIDTLVDEKNRQHRLAFDKFQRDALESGEKAMVNKGQIHNQELSDEMVLRGYLNQIAKNYQFVKQNDGTMMIEYIDLQGNKQKLDPRQTTASLQSMNAKMQSDNAARLAEQQTMTAQAENERLRLEKETADAKALEAEELRRTQAKRQAAEDARIRAEEERIKAEEAKKKASGTKSNKIGGYVYKRKSF